MALPSKLRRTGRRDRTRLAGPGRRHRPAAVSPETRALRHAADACNAALAHYAREADDLDLGLMACLMDCAELSAATAAFVARGSDHADALRQTCADVADCVVEGCARYGRVDVLAACSDACRAARDALRSQATPRVG